MHNIIEWIQGDPLMKYLKQFGIILIITFIGEIMHALIPLPIPGNIYGLVLMFVLLCTRVLPLEAVKETAQFLIAIMPVMFIPAGAGLIDSWSELSPILVQVVVITLVSTIVVMVVTGKIAQAMIKGAKGESK